MTEFKQFIVERHPDPDTLFVLENDVFEQMCKLATEFAEKTVKDYDLLHNVSNSRELLICDKCKVFEKDCIEKKKCISCTKQL